MTILRKPSSAEISANQNDSRSLQTQIACRTSYAQAKRLYAVGSGGSLILALGAPILAILAPPAGVYLGALAGAWLFVSRLVLTPLAKSKQAVGAVVQAKFDELVLGVSSAIGYGSEVAAEEINALARGRSVEAYRDWYAPVANATWPASVISCQRATCVWSRRQHKVYAQWLLLAAVLVFLSGIVISISKDALLGAYLAGVLLPSLPFLLDASELVQGHLQAARHRRELEVALSAPDALVDAEGLISSTQSALFEVRSRGPLIPDFVYRRLERDFNEDMRAAQDHA